MSFPSVVARGSNRTTASNTTTHAITLPAHLAGDRLVVHFASDGSAATSVNTGSSSSGWEKLGQASNTTVVSGSIFTIIAESASETLTITTAASEQSSHTVLVVRPGAGKTTEIAGGSANGSSTNSNPPSLTPGAGAVDYLWIATRAGDSTVVATVAPTSFGNLQTQAAAGTAGASSNTAERELNAASNDPAAFTSTSEQWVSWTLAVWEVDLAVAPTITTQPTNQSTPVGDTATFTASAAGTPTPDLQWEALGGGSSTAVLSVSNVSLTTSAAQTPSVTVPAGANAFIIGSEYYNASSQAVTFSGSGWMTVQASGGDWDFNWANNAYAAGKVTATGSQTLSVSATRTFDEGPTCQIIWLTVADPDDWILAHAAVPPNASPTTLTLNIASETDGLVLGVFGNFSTPSVPSGTTQIGDPQTTNGHTALAYSVDSVGASTTSITSGSYAFPTLFGVSVKAGSVAAWENVTGGTGATTGSWTTPTQTEEGVTNIRLKASNTAGTVYSDVVTLTVTPAASAGNASGALAGVSLAAATATASGGSSIPGDASGSLAGITLSAPAATASSPTSAALPKVRVGAAWVEGVVKVRAGAAWVSGALKRWNGSSWDGA